MTNYIQKEIKRLKALKTGIHNNAGVWTNAPITEADIDAQITTLEKAEKSITDAANKLSENQNLAHGVADKTKVVSNQAENLAFGFHALDAEKLVEYGIKPRKTAQAKPVPGKAVISSIADDTDGEGFILQRQTTADADTYEWQKAAGTEPAVTNIDESKYTHYKTTKKEKFVDDDVKKGVRYFYRTRGINATGSGAWSEGVSRVQ